MSDNTFLAVLTGTSPYKANDFSEAVAARFELVKGTDAFSARTEPDERTGERHCYDGNRCLPENLGWRVVQNFGEIPVDKVASGAYDAQIAETFHGAARFEYYYRYEKDWG